MGRNPLERISEREISDKDLRSEISRLERVTEPSSFWLDIAKDRTYSTPHRALAICQFFKRHVREPIPILDLARLLDSPDWINSSTVTMVKHVKGEMPVQWNMGETVLAIRPFSAQGEGLPVLYLRLSQSLEPETFVRIMSAPQDGVTGAGVRVLEAACDG